MRREVGLTVASGEIMAVAKSRILDGGKVRPFDVKAGDRFLFAAALARTNVLHR
jgi:co-chaperonin GroES (HSP10)